MKTDVLFIVKKRGSGYDAYNPYERPFGLLYSARFVAQLLRENGVLADVVQAIDGNEIDKLVVERDPSAVILEALWATPAKVRELMSLKRHAHRKWVIRIHSKPSFISLEGIAAKWLHEFDKLADEFPNLVLAANNSTAVLEFSEAFAHKFVYLPNYYIPGPVKQRDPFWPQPHVLKVGCFGAIRPLKNTLEQAIAAIIYANAVRRPLEFYVNATRIEQQGDNVLKNLRALFEGQAVHKLVEVEWKSHKDFLQLIAQMELGMQVSFSETFNIVAADFASVGVPIVVSPEISWLPKLFQVGPTNGVKIAIRMGDLNVLPRFITRALMRWSLARYNRKSRKAWLAFVRGEA